MRTVELVEPLRDDLAALRPAKPARGALVIAGRAGEYVDLRNWRNRVWKPAVEKAGVDAAPYDLRHTYASLLIHEGRSLAYVAASMGHSTAVTTLTHYAHMFDEQRLATGVRMVDAVVEARRGVRNLCAPSAPRRLRQAAPRR
jgi:integrase